MRTSINEGKRDRRPSHASAQASEPSQIMTQPAYPFAAPLPEDEACRLETLLGYDILDTEQEERFERITRIAAHILDVPIVLVSLIDSDRQWFKSAFGLDAEQTSRDIAFCAYTILDDAPLVVSDAQADPRFAQNPLVTGDPGIRFYAGAPLITRNKQRLGTLCAIDVRPRTITAKQAEILQDLAALVVDELELRLTARKDQEAAAIAAALATAEQENARLGAIVNNASHEILMLNAQDLRIMSANRGASKNLGYSPDELREMSLLDVSHGLRKQDLETLVAPLHSGEQRLVNFEGICRRKDMSIYPANIRAELDTTGNNDLLVVFITDRTDIDEISARMRLAFNAAEFYLMSWHLDTGRIDREAAVDQLFGFERYDPNRTVADFQARIHPADLQQNMADMEKVKNGQAKIFDRTFRAQQPSGEQRWLRAVGQMSDHQPNLMVGLQSDVTDAVLAARAQQKSQQDLQILFRSIPDCVTRAKPDTTLTFVNESFVRFTGQAAPDLIGRKFVDFAHDDVRDDLSRRLAALTPENAFITSEERAVAPDGSEICLLWTNQMVFEDGVPQEIISVGRDITHQDQARRTTEAQAKALEQTNQALKTSEDRFQLAVQGASVGIWDWAPGDDDQQYWSTKFQELLGYKPGELKSTKQVFMDLVHPDDREPTLLLAEAHLSKRTKFEIEYRLLHKTDGYRWFLGSGRASFDDQGAPIRMVGTIMDIHDRKIAEADLQASEERFRALYNDTPTMLHSTDSEGLLIAVSDDWLDALGYQRDEVLGRRPRDFLAPESYASARLRSQLSSPDATIQRDIPCSYVRKTGEKLSCLQSTVSEFDGAGNLERTLAVILDVTEKQRIQDKLAKQQRELQMIFDHAPVRIWYKDERNNVVRLNKRAADAIGMTVEQVEGKNIYQLTPDVAHDHHLQDLEVIKSGQPMHGIIEHSTSPDGAHVWTSTDKVPYTDPETGQTLLLETSSDITALKSAELMMAEQAEALQRSNEELEQFAYVASHDLKAPLRGIDNLAGWIEEDMAAQMNEDSKKNMRLLRSRVARLEELLDGLLQYSRAGRGNSDVTAVDLNEIVADVFDLVRGQRPFKLDHGTLPHLTTGLVPLQLVLRNLISNAIKHHDRSAGTITVGVAERGDCLHVTVGDDGPGIDPAFHEKIFGMFQVLKPRDQVEGSGLGLAIIAKQLRTLGCDIWIESDPAVGRGTKFHFTWPKDWPQKALPARTEAAA